jgi:polar amino acid transport system permease protein
MAGSRPNPHKRNILITRLISAPWWLLVILAMVLAVAILVSENTLYENAWSQIRQGIWTTIWVTFVAYALACLMGLTIALLRRPSKNVVYMFLVYQPISVYVEMVRGIPTLVLVYYVVLALVPQGIGLTNDLGEFFQDEGITAFGIDTWLMELTVRDVPAPWRAVVALAVSYSAFLSEIFRAGLESIEKGQHEAARSLGMNPRQVMRLVVLPQAIRNILPPLGNDFIAMLKESSLVSVVGVKDITNRGRGFAASTFTLFPAYNLLALTYLVMTLSLSMLVKGMEMYLGRSRRAED